MLMTTTATQESSGALKAISSDAQPVSFRSAYREVAERAYESDVIVQLKSNLAQLEDMHARMSFMMGELSYLLKKG